MGGKKERIFKIDCKLTQWIQFVTVINQMGITICNYFLESVRTSENTLMGPFDAGLIISHAALLALLEVYTTYLRLDESGSSKSRSQSYQRKTYLQVA